VVESEEEDEGMAESDLESDDLMQAGRKLRSRNKKVQSDDDDEDFN